MTGSRSSYFSAVQATCNATINVDDWFITIAPTASVSLTIKKIRFGLSTGTTTVIRDAYYRLKLQSFSGTPATGTAGTPRALDGTSAASTSTLTVKNGTNNFTGGSIIKTFDVISYWSNLSWEWSARDKDDEIVLLPGESFGVAVSCSTTAFNCTNSVVWSEG